MDKIFEQIKYLKVAINLRKIEYENLTKEKKVLENEKNKLNVEKERLEQSKSSCQVRKSYYLYVQDNINYWKKQTIILVLITQLLIFGGNLLMFDSLKLLPILIPNLTIIPVFIHGGYYKNKKYLKKVNITDIENEINTKDNDINLLNKKINLFQKELDKVLENINNIIDVINKLEEVRIATELRNNVINNYIENNKEFETLINSEFEDNFDKKTKTFTKKKQESKSK